MGRGIKNARRHCCEFQRFWKRLSLIILRNVMLPLREITIKLQKLDVDLCSLWIDGSSAETTQRADIGTDSTHGTSMRSVEQCSTKY